MTKRVYCPKKDTIGEDFPLILARNNGMIIHACAEAKISPMAYYKWCRKDPEFKEKCDLVRKQITEGVINLMFDMMTENPTLIMYYLNKRGHEYGYGSTSGATALGLVKLGNTPEEMETAHQQIWDKLSDGDISLDFALGLEKILENRRKNYETQVLDKKILQLELEYKSLTK